MGAYYVIKDPLNPGSLRYLYGAWPNPNGSDGVGNKSLTAILNTSSNTTYVMDGGTSGLVYSNTELGTGLAQGMLSSYKSGIRLQIATSNDPDFNSHNGEVTFLAIAGAILLSTVSMNSFTFKGITFKSTSAGASNMMMDLNTTTGLFDACKIINNYGLHTSGSVLIRGNGTRITFADLQYSGTGDNIVILHNDGTLTVRTCNIDASNIHSHAAINCSGSTVFLESSDITGSGGDGGNMAVAIGGVSYCEMSGCNISNYGNSPVLIASNARGVTIVSNTISGCVGYGIINNSPSAQIFNNTIHDIVYNSNGYGIYNNANGCSIFGNTIYNIDANGINNVGNNNDIYGNIVYNCWNGLVRGSGGVGGAICIGGAASGNKIYQNYVYNNFTGITIATSTGTGANAIFSNLLVHNYVNDIDDQYDSGTNHELIYNNTVIHSPDYVISGNAYIGHGIAVHVHAQKAKVINNIVIVNQAVITCDGLAYSQTNDNLIEIISDYNQVYSTCDGANIGTLNFLGYTNMVAWKTALIANGNGKIKGLDGTVNSVEAHSSDQNPLLVSSSDFHLTAVSPCINTGYDLGADYAIDYDGLSQYSYGTYDRGAFLYPGTFLASFSKLDNIVGLSFSQIAGIQISNIAKLNNFS